MARRQAAAGKRPPARRVAPLKEELLVALAAALRELDDARVPFALVGGLAMGVRADPRVTREIEFVVPVEGDDEAEARVFALQQRRFIVESVFVRVGGRISTIRTRPGLLRTC